MWDLRHPKISQASGTLDSGTSPLTPFFDKETGLLFLAGKGDGNIRYFEYQDGSLHFLDEYASGVAQRGTYFDCTVSVQLLFCCILQASVMLLRD